MIMNNYKRKISKTIDYLYAWDWGHNIDDENLESNETKCLIELCNDLIKIVKAFYHNDQSFYKMDMITKYKTVIKTVWLAFERNIAEFQKSIEKRYSREISKKVMRDESEVICSWVCVRVIFALLPQRNTKESDIF